MKKRILILLLLLALVLSACGDQTAIHMVEYDNHILVLDTGNKTITQGDTVYTYEIAEHGSVTRYTIFYPDGASYSMSRSSGGISSGGGDALYHGSERLDGNGLIDIVMKYEGRNQAKQKNPTLFLCGLVIIGLGVFLTTAPYTAWYIRWGRWYRDAEPSDFALGFTRFSGVAMIVMGVIVLFI